MMARNRAEHVTVQRLLRWWPFPRGAGRIVDRFFSKLTFQEDVAITQTTAGFTMKVLPNEGTGRHLYFTGQFARDIVDVLYHFAEPGDVLLDIGANVGYVSGCFLNNIRESKVIAVEPQPRIVDLLRSNLDQFGFGRWQVAPVALSDRDGEGWFEICLDDRSLSRLASEEKNERASKIELCRVEIWSGDRLFSNLNVQKLDLVKIDVEGHEETAINSCLPHFARLQPRAIVFESWGTKSAPGGSIGSVFNNIGYRIFGIEKYLMSFKLVPISSETDCRFNDYVAVSGKRVIPKAALRKL